MSRFIFFLTLGFIYLALLHAYSPSEKQIIDIKNNSQLGKSIQATPNFNDMHPYTVVLIDVYREGVFIKTSFITVKLISPFHPASELTYKVNSNYYHYLKPYIGYEIYHHAPNKDYAINTVLPPGFSFLGNPILGYWKKNQDQKYWRFYRFYRHLYKDLAWNTPNGQYQPTVKDYHAVRKLPTFKGVYHTSSPQRQDNKVSFTRERKNIILKYQEFFGPKGKLTPFLASNYIKKRKQNKNSSVLDLFKGFFQAFVRPLHKEQL